MIAPVWRRRKQPKTQDGYLLRRYKRCWKVKRLFAQLGSFQRLLFRYEDDADHYPGLVQLGCIMVLLRYQ